MGRFFDTPSSNLSHVLMAHVTKDKALVQRQLGDDYVTYTFTMAVQSWVSVGLGRVRG